MIALLLVTTICHGGIVSLATCGAQAVPLPPGTTTAECMARAPGMDALYRSAEDDTVILGHRCMSMADTMMGAE